MDNRPNRWWGPFVRFFSAVFGGFTWTSPGWLTAIPGKTERGKTWAKAHRSTVLGGVTLAVVGSIAAFAIHRWYLTLPQPQLVHFEVKMPAATRLADDAKPDTLELTFSGSIARLEDVGKAVKKGIRVSPAVEGEWRWVSDAKLVFTPRADWLIEQDYSVSFERAAFRREVKVDTYDWRFHTAPFTAVFRVSTFYQHPENPEEKFVSAVVKFSHPVAVDDFKKRVALKFVSKKDSKPFGYSITFDKFFGEAIIHSDRVGIPLLPTQMVVTVERGVRAAAGGRSTGEKLEASVEVPDMFSFFRIEASRLGFARNEHYDLDRVLVIETTADVKPAEIAHHLSARALPALPSENGEPRSVQSVGELNPQLLARARKLELEAIPQEKDYGRVHSFKVRASPGESVHVKLSKGIKSYGDYVLASDHEEIVHAQPFPEELRILHEGSILSLAGEKKLTVQTRGVPAIRFEVARVMPGAVQHFISQTSGTFRDPAFASSYRFSEDNIAERFSETTEVEDSEDGVSQYTAIDFSTYLSKGNAANRRGLFLLTVEAAKPDEEGKGVSAKARKKRRHRRAFSKSDRRFVLVTDLGLVVKDSPDKSHDLFVASLASGRPVAGAKIEVIGKNGLPVVSRMTDEQGHARLEALDEFTREQAPVAYLVTRGSDLSFLPFDRPDRRLDSSRFDVGGVEGASEADRLTAYLFSDRGIYRPGDEARIGMIVKAGDWKGAIAGVPVEAVVTDSRGNDVHHEKLALSESGFEELRFKTDETSPTGVYHASLYVVKDAKRDSLLGSVDVKVEEFLPDRMKIATHLSDERKEGWVSPEDLKASVRLTNLYGTPAAKHKVAGQLRLSPTWPAFRGWKEWHFNDPLHAKNAHEERLEDGETDDDGKAEFKLDLNRFGNATYALSFHAEGYELEGGRAVASESSVIVSPAEFLLGYKADGELGYIAKKAERSVQLVAIDSALKPRAAPGLTAQLLELRYVSVLTKDTDETYKYQSVRKEVELWRKPYDFKAKAATFVLATEKPGDYALVFRDKKDAELLRVPYTVAGHGNLTRSLEKNAELHVSLSRPDYAPGDEIEMQVKAPYSGAGLITVEREKVFAWKWFKADTTTSVQKIRMPAGLEGNGYVNVTFVRAIDSREIFMSPLSHGIVPFSVSRKSRTIAVELDVPELARPGEDFKIGYSADRPSKIAVFAVDEGILRVAGYKTPDPLAHFFRKRALEVKTLQILDQLLPEFSIVQELAAAGGDAEGRKALGKNLNPFRRKRDKPAVYWSGILEAGPDKRELSYSVPDTFNGTLRVMAVAVSQGALGAAEKSGIVRGDFVISPNLASFVAPGDEFELTTTVGNNTASPAVQLAIEVSDQLEIVGPGKQSLKIAEGHDGSAAFRLRARQKLGAARVTFTASSDAGRPSRYSAELSVRPAVAYLTTPSTGHLQHGSTEVNVPRRMHADFRANEVTVSQIPLVLAHGLTRYLEQFPHGCTEQIISQAWPAISLRDHPEFGISAEKTESSFKETLRVLRTRQNGDGSFGYWAPGPGVPPIVTAYVLHYLTEAREKGLSVPRELLDRGLDYLKRIAAQEARSRSEARDTAYALYLLARNGITMANEATALRKALIDGKWTADLGAAMLASTFKLYKQDQVAMTLMKDVWIGASVLSEYVVFYDSLLHDAFVLYLKARHFPEALAEVKAEQLIGIAKQVQEGTYNTISSNTLIMALDAYAKVAGALKPGEIAIEELAAKGEPRAIVLPAGSAPRAAFNETSDRIRVRSSGDLALFFQVTQAGFDLELPKKEIMRKLEVYRELRAVGGDVLTKVALGNEVEVHLKLRSELNEPQPNIAVVDLLPGGFEVITDSIRPGVKPVEAPAEGETPPEEQPAAEPDQDAPPPSEEGDAFLLDRFLSRFAAPDRAPAASALSAFEPDYVDVREDRVVLYGTVSSEAREFVYRMRAVARGTFVVPPIAAASMYDRAIQAQGIPGKIEVEARK